MRLVITAVFDKLIRKHSGEPRVSPNGEHIAFVDGEKTLRVYGVETKKQIFHRKMPYYIHPNFAFSSDANQLALTLRDNTSGNACKIEVWDLDKNPSAGKMLWNMLRYFLTQNKPAWTSKRSDLVIDNVGILNNKFVLAKTLQELWAWDQKGTNNWCMPSCDNSRFHVSGDKLLLWDGEKLDVMEITNAGFKSNLRYYYQTPQGPLGPSRACLSRDSKKLAIIWASDNVRIVNLVHRDTAIEEIPLPIENPSFVGFLNPERIVTVKSGSALSNVESFQNGISISRERVEGTITSFEMDPNGTTFWMAGFKKDSSPKTLIQVWKVELAA